jgi:hypothetical protein
MACAELGPAKIARAILYTHSLFKELPGCNLNQPLCQ